MKTMPRILFVGLALLLGASRASAFTISGTVSDTALNPAANVEIRLFDGGGTPIGIPLTLTDAAGGYAVAGLPAGSYVLQFRPPAATRLLAAEFPATISTGDVTLNAPLQTGNLLSGYVRDPAGVGIPDIDLQVVDRDTGQPVLTPGDDTDATGFYDVVVPSSEFDLEWRSVAVGGLPWIPVEMRQEILTDTVIDVDMVIGMFVSGTVRDEAGLPVAGVNLDFIDTATGVKLDTPGDNTTVAGTYQVQVPVGTYEVIAKPQLADRLAAGHIPLLDVPADLTGVDLTLAPGVLVSGRVTASGGGGVANADIDMETAVGGEPVVIPFDVTDVLGDYAVVVPPGTYHVTISPPTGSPLAPHVTPSFAATGDVVLNVTLVNGVTLSGVVVGPGGVPQVGVDLDLELAGTGISVPIANDLTGVGGAYSLLVEPGTYDVEVEPSPALGLVAERLTSVPVAGATVRNFSLAAGLRIGGTVTDEIGMPAPGVNLDVVRVSDGVELFTPGDGSDAAGAYQVVVPAGTYDLIFHPAAGYAVQDPVIFSGVNVGTDLVQNVTLRASVLTGVDDAPALPALAAAPRAEPNPFNPATRIAFELSRATHVRLRVHDLSGAVAAELADGPLAAGSHAFAWTGRATDGRELPSGVYLYVVQAGAETAVGKVTLLK